MVKCVIAGEFRSDATAIVWIGLSICMIMLATAAFLAAQSPTTA